MGLEELIIPAIAAAGVGIAGMQAAKAISTISSGRGSPAAPAPTPPVAPPPPPAAPPPTPAKPVISAPPPTPPIVTPPVATPTPDPTALANIQANRVAQTNMMNGGRAATILTNFAARPNVGVGAGTQDYSKKTLAAG